jgi:hypothetical protein
MIQKQANIIVTEAIEESSTDLMVAPSQGISLASALHVNTHFASTATLTGDGYAPRRLSWATGNNAMFASNGKTPLEAARGWILDQPNQDELFPADYELMDAMDVLIEQGKARAVVVEHFDKDGRPNKVPSWQFLPGLSLFVICEGVPNKSEMHADVTCRWGVAYAWPKGIDSRTGKSLTSSLQFLCFAKELMDAGYNGSLSVRFSSYLTDKALSALRAHEYVLSFAEKLRSGGEPLAWYAYAQYLQISVNTLTAGTEQGKTKQLYYPIPAIPRLSPKDMESAMGYLASMAITIDQAYIIEAGDRVRATVTWSEEKSKRILAGNDADENTALDVPGGGAVDVDGNVIVESSF